MNSNNDYKRAITHTKFKSTISNKRGYIENVIYNSSVSFTKEEITTYSILANSNLWVHRTSKIGVYMYLVVIAFIFLSSVYINYSGNYSYGWYELLIGFFLLFYLTYLFTAPKKEFILNRADGLVTFPGFMWLKNITMPVKEVVFSKTVQNMRGYGANELQIESPYFIGVKYYTMLKSDCYSDLSYIIWYMDKNRPLPPGTAFDEYRQADFERRKAEGFPKPLFHSNVLTPEATPEQQAERRRIGGW